MEVTLTIPDDVAREIQNGSLTPVSRRLLELAAIKAYEEGLITERGVIDMHGLGGGKSCMDFSSDLICTEHIDMQSE